MQHSRQNTGFGERRGRPADRLIVLTALLACAPPYKNPLDLHPPGAYLACKSNEICQIASKQEDLQMTSETVTKERSFLIAAMDASKRPLRI